MKQQLAIHGRDHRLGGADPAPFELPWCWVSNGHTTQTVTTDAEVVFSSSKTNDRRTFRWDSNDPNGILVYRRGLYQVFVAVHYAVGSISVPRTVYGTFAQLSAGALGGLGVEWGQNQFALGAGQTEDSVGEVDATTPIAKSVLNHVGMARLPTVDVTDPWRFAAIASHLGTNYDIGGTLDSGLTVIRVGDIGDDTPAPTDMTP